MIHFDVMVENGPWPKIDHLERLCQRVLEAAENHPAVTLSEDSEVSLMFTDDEAVQALNKQWREQDKPTNVLSFAANEGGGPVTPLLGDIVLAQETIAREAKEQSKPFDNHLSHLVLHGFLHLLGYDHIEASEAETMETLETRILASLSIADPYGVS